MAFDHFFDGMTKQRMIVNDQDKLINPPLNRVLLHLSVSGGKDIPDKGGSDVRTRPTKGRGQGNRQGDALQPQHALAIKKERIVREMRTTGILRFGISFSNSKHTPLPRSLWPTQDIAYPLV